MDHLRELSDSIAEFWDDASKFTWRVSKISNEHCWRRGQRTAGFQTHRPEVRI